MASDSYMKKGGIDKTWRSIKVTLVDSNHSMKRTLIVNDQVLLSKEFV